MNQQVLSLLNVYFLEVNILDNRFECQSIRRSNANKQMSLTHFQRHIIIIVVDWRMTAAFFGWF